jgi:hypothetical protein
MAAMSVTARSSPLDGRLLHCRVVIFAASIERDPYESMTLAVADDRVRALRA